jgi:hypothetical protein
MLAGNRINRSYIQKIRVTKLLQKIRTIVSLITWRKNLFTTRQLPTDKTYKDDKKTQAMKNSGRSICNFGAWPVMQMSTNPIGKIHARFLIHVRIMTTFRLGAGDDTRRIVLCEVVGSIIFLSSIIQFERIEPEFRVAFRVDDRLVRLIVNVASSPRNTEI